MMAFIRVLLISLFGIILFFTSCQPPKGGRIPLYQAPCTDTNNNGICDDKDTDGDGVLDEKENEIGTDINDSDTDKDGTSDLCEIQKGTDPTDDSSKTSECQEKTEEPIDQDDPSLMSACILMDEQKKQKEWFDEKLVSQKVCEEHKITKEINGEEKTDTEKECTVTTSSGESGIGAENHGVLEDADKNILTIKVKWGVSYRDVLMLANGILTIKPWPVFYHHLWGGFWTSDRQYDHHLFDLPSTSSACDESILNRAIVTINDQIYEWQHPAFTSFKIPQVENVYPFSTDGFGLSDKTASDKIEYLGSPNNNFSYRNHLISVQVKNDYSGPGDQGFWGGVGHCSGGPCKYENSLCETREIEFKYEFFKTKSDDSSFEFDFKELEEQCKEVLD